MGGQQGIAGDLRAHLAIAQNEVGEDGEHRTTRGALETPDGDRAQPDPDLMRGVGPAPTPVTGRVVPELKAQGEEKRAHPFDKALPSSSRWK